MSKHGNCNDNTADHHLYEVLDREYNDVYKFGICGEPLLDDETSPRARQEVKELNRAVRWLRFFHRVLLSRISGRMAAKQIEDEYIANYTEKHGFAPPGNDTEEDWED